MGGGPGGGEQKIRPDRRHADFFGGPKQSSHAGKTHFFINLQVFSIFHVFQKRRFTRMGAQFSCCLMFFVGVCVFCVFEDTSKTAVLPAWELNFRKLDQHFYVFWRFLEMQKTHVFTCLSFSCFFTIFGVFLEASGLLLASFWRLCRLFGFLVSSFWVPLAWLGCLWTLTAAFCGAFGSSGLSVGSGTAPGLFFASFSIHFGVICWAIRGGF